MQHVKTIIDGSLNSKIFMVLEEWSAYLGTTKKIENNNKK